MILVEQLLEPRMIPEELLLVALLPVELRLPEELRQSRGQGVRR